MISHMDAYGRYMQRIKEGRNFWPTPLSPGEESLQTVDVHALVRRLGDAVPSLVDAEVEIDKPGRVNELPRAIIKRGVENEEFGSGYMWDFL